mmetsp:Transcript_138053/g.251290  ORF Transcript_138053/g.251290 Transcript_138053/m.251290 type:complete len:501 (+) Transcript_138053:81-1583(+)
MAVKRLGTSRSEGSISGSSRLSDSRRQKLLNLKAREDLKDALTSKFKSRFGHRAPQRAPDETSVASADIKNEVTRFAEVADVTEANLGRLERRLHKRALNKTPAQPDATSNVSGVSAYSTMSQMPRSRSFSSGRGGSGQDWSMLDEYASYLHEQDALRQKAGTIALQRKFRKDLDNQVAQKKATLHGTDDEDRRYHKNMMIDLGRWKELEMNRAQEVKQKHMREKRDRDEQLAYEQRLKDEAAKRKQLEDAFLVNKIVNELEADQRRYAKKKMETKKAMRKMYEDSLEDQRRRNQAMLDEKERDASNMREYTRILEEQEEQRAEELAARLQRQKDLMAKIQANVAAQATNARDNDALRAAKQQEEMDAHYFEAERIKQQRLKQMRLDTQAYLFKQMAEKDARREEEKELQSIQAQIQKKDTQEYGDIELEKENNRRRRNFENRMELERQIEQRSKVRVAEMSESEKAMNKDLLRLAEKTLELRDERTLAAWQPREGEEDY